MRIPRVIPVMFSLCLVTGVFAQSQWTPRNPLPTGQTLNFVTWTGSRLVAAGNGGVILTSSDGITWTNRISGTASPIYSAAWTGSQSIAVGNGGVILTSSDDITWTSRTSGTTNPLFSVAWTGSQLVVVGSAGTILT